MPPRVRVLGMLYLMVLVMYFDRLCIAVAGPRMQHDLGITPSHWGWVIGAFTLGYAMFEIPSGMLGDRIGPRKVLTRIVLWWSAFTALTGAMTSFRMLLGVRFLFGAGEAGAFPNCWAVIGRWIPAAQRARASSIVWTATASGGVLTPFLVVALQKAYGWRAAYYVFACLGIFWTALWYSSFRDSPGANPVNPAVRPPAIAWAKLLRNGNFIRLLLMYHTYCWGAYFYLSWLPTYLQMGRGLTEDQMKFAAAAPAGAGVIGLLAGGFLSDRLARKYSLRVARCSVGSVGLTVAGIALLLATLTRNNSVAVALIVIGLAFMDLMLPVSWSMCVDMAQEHAGAISGAMNTAGQLGSLISSVAFGYWVEWFGSYDHALMPLAAMLLVSGVLFASINPAMTLTAPGLDQPQAAAVS